MSFTIYLQEKKLALSTINSYNKYIANFLTWLATENVEAALFTYNDLLEFMRYCQDKGVTKKSVNMLLGIIRHYCNYLIHQKQRNDNPATGIFIKGLVRQLPSNLLSIEDLELLYKQYSIQLNVDASKKIMLGLLIYQGLKVEEIMRVQAKQINLLEASIFITGTKRSNERNLPLQAIQVPLLQDYLSKNKFEEKAFFAKQKTINNSMQYMFNQLKQLSNKVINAKQIRSSVITEWLRKNDLRQVQYMAGHKYVSSTERYQTNHLDDLQTALKAHHPQK